MPQVSVYKEIKTPFALYHPEAWQYNLELLHLWINDAYTSSFVQWDICDITLEIN